MRIAEDLREILEDLCCSGRRTLNDAAARLDMRAVVIVEFWARYMIDELPYGWRWVYVAESAAYSGSDVEHIAAPPGGGACETTVAGAWGAEYAARPRLDP